MRKLLIPVLALLFLSGALPCPLAETEVPLQKPAADPGHDISVRAAYLEQARALRDEGRYELSRQSYTQALSTCRDAANLAIIKKELEGVKLLIRTMH